MNLHRVAAVGLAGTIGLGVPLAVVSPAVAGGGCHAGPTEEAGDTVTLAANCMGPTVLHTDVGTTVRFVNQDPIAHNVYGAGWGTDHLKPGVAFTHTFDEAGTFPYTCTLHPGMVGAVEVGDGDSPAVAAPATQPVASATSPSSSDGMGVVGVGAVAVVAFGAGAGAVAARRKLLSPGG